MLNSMTQRKEREELHSSPRTSLAAWKALLDLAREARSFSIREAFASDPRRFDRFHAQACGILLDYSKQAVTPAVMDQLFQLAGECDLAGWRTRMFGGVAINESENRAVLHTALRAPAGQTAMADGVNISPLIHDTLSRMKAFCEQVHTDKAFTSVVNIGIGGSDLGPHMANEALKPFADAELRTHYVSNVDAAHLYGVLKECDPARTLFIVTSKTFTTQETMTNAQSAKLWLQQELETADVAEHFAAVTQNTDKAEAFGIRRDRIFPIWDWVGGRYSLWSAVGLPLCLSVGYENFKALLEGAHAMDRHFLEAPFEKNLPVLLALTGMWNRTFLEHAVLALLPYSQLLHKFPSFIQQLDMESNGKSVDRDGTPVPYPTGPVIFGESGTNGQHAFYQLLHQGTTVVPCEFIAVVQSDYPSLDHQQKLLSHAIGQTKALMDGKADPDPQKRFDGNRPSSTLVLRHLDPYTLGALVALYEHKIFTQGVLWNLNSFDQWGVELGKKIAGQVLPSLSSEALSADTPDLDSSTRALVDAVRSFS